MKAKQQWIQRLGATALGSVAIAAIAADRMAPGAAQSMPPNSRTSYRVVDLGAVAGNEMPNDEPVAGDEAFRQALAEDHPFVCAPAAESVMAADGLVGAHAYITRQSAEHTVGYYWMRGENRTHAFDRSGGLILDLGGFSRGGSGACAVNENGGIVGWAVAADGRPHAFFRPGTVGAPMRDLGLSDGGRCSIAQNVNEAGQIVGSIEISDDGNWAGFLVCTDPAGNVVSRKQIPSLGGSSSRAYGINSAGAVVGSAQTGVGRHHAFIYEKSNLTDLNSAIPADSEWVLERAYSINDSGQIAGIGLLNGTRHAFAMQRQTLPPAAPSMGGFLQEGMTPLRGISIVGAMLASALLGWHRLSGGRR